MKLSVIILNYNVRYFLELCLKSVQAAVSNLEAEIIVVDNDSHDDSCSMVKQLFPNVKLIRNTKNLGFSKGNNIGVKQAKGEYVCILNPDTVVAEDTFEKLLLFADQAKDTGIIGCKLIDGTGAFLPESKRNIPTPYVSIKKVLGNSYAYYANHLSENQKGEVDILVGAFMLIKRDVYNEVKGFDEDYFMYGEDIDISYKVLKAGYKNYYNPSTTVIHYKGESTLKDKTYVKRFNGAMQIFFKKHFSSNVAFDVVFWLGIRLVPQLHKELNGEVVEVRENIFISENSHEALKNMFQKNIKSQTKINSYIAKTQYVLDNNTFSFKSIIGLISKNDKVGSTTFKILPKRSNFIIGSNSSKSMGEVILFENN